MSSNRLIYDTCAYKHSLAESVGTLGWVLDPSRFENCNKCRIEFGVVGGTNVSHAKGNLVDLETELRGTTKLASKCPTLKYQNPCPTGDMTTCQPQQIVIKGNPSNQGPMDWQTRKSKTKETRARSAQVNPKRAAERNQMRAAAESAMFKLMDENADGLLDSDEYANADKPQLMQKARQMVAFAQFDANKDGFIAPDELPNPMAQLRQFDANNDGIVNKREMRRGLRARREANDS